MNIELIHSFILSCNDPGYLFGGKRTISSFHYRVEKLSDKEASIEFDFQIDEVNKDQFLSEEQKNDALEEIENNRKRFINKFKGDCLEVFVEFLIKFMGTDPLIGVHEYQVEQDNDWGVDGFGIGNNNKPITVQVKFRNSDCQLTWNDSSMGNFAADSAFKYGVNTKVHYDKNLRTEVHNLLVITTGKKFHHSITDRSDGAKIRILNYHGLCILVDNNEVFWSRFEETWMSSLRRVQV